MWSNYFTAYLKITKAAVKRKTIHLSSMACEDFADTEPFLSVEELLPLVSVLRLMRYFIRLATTTMLPNVKLSTTNHLLGSNEAWARCVKACLLTTQITQNDL